MQIIEYIDLYLAAILNIMFCAIIIRKVFGISMTRNQKRKIAVLLLPALLVAIINLFNKDVFKVLITLPVFVIGIKGIFNINFDKSFLYVLAATFYMFIGEIVVGIIFSFIPVDYAFTLNNVLGRTLGCVSVIICTIPFIYIGFLRKIFKAIFDNPKANQGKVVLGSILFLMLISAMTYKNTTGVTDILSTMMNGIIFIVIACIAYSLYRESQKAKELSDNYNVLLTYLEKYEKELVEKRKIIHDYKNEIIIINGYIGNDNKLKEYVNEIMEEQKNLKDRHAVRNIDKLPSGLKGLMYYKLSQLDENIIVDMEVEGNMKKFDKIPSKISKDILKIIGVLIDNAIEAVLREKEKYIDIRFEIKRNKFITKINNTCSVKLNKKDIMEEGYSAKGKGRGYGLSLVKDIIKKDERYSLDIDIEDEQFKSTLIVSI